MAGKVVIDLCAAPGGKTAQLAALGARVTALDISPGHGSSGCAPKISTAEARWRELVTADVRDWRPCAPAPFVLLDAPCTATGTIRRHPDLPWLKGAADLISCESLQSELLEAAAEMTAAGGMLVYAVCSLEPEEGEEQIGLFLRRRTGISRAGTGDRPEEVFDAAFISDEGDLKTLPFHWGGQEAAWTDFYARLEARVHG